jgi:hypothetical protein
MTAKSKEVDLNTLQKSYAIIDLGNNLCAMEIVWLDGDKIVKRERTDPNYIVIVLDLIKRGLVEDLYGPLRKTVF